MDNIRSICGPLQTNDRFNTLPRAGRDEDLVLGHWKSLLALPSHSHCELRFLPTAALCFPLGFTASPCPVAGVLTLRLLRGPNSSEKGLGTQKCNYLHPICLHKSHCRHALTHSLARARTHPCMHAHMHARTHVHAHTNPRHLHVYSLTPSLSLSLHSFLPITTLSPHTPKHPHTLCRKTANRSNSSAVANTHAQGFHI